jgi:hypothetical protein
MKWFQNTYTRRLNTRHGKWGHVFGGRYKAVVVQSSEERGSDYLCSLIDYVHLNPVRAGLVRLEEGMGLLDYPWSSLTRGYAVVPGQRETWMAAREGLELFGYADRAKGRRDFVRRLERRALEKFEGDALSDRGLQNTLRRGCIGAVRSFGSACWRGSNTRKEIGITERVIARRPRNGWPEVANTSKSPAYFKTLPARSALLWLGPCIAEPISPRNGSPRRSAVQRGQRESTGAAFRKGHRARLRPASQACGTPAEMALNGQEL